MSAQFPLLKEFVAFISERWSIHTKRCAGQPSPWTKDPILRRYRFCNVRREDDRVTQWIHKEWLLPHTHDKNVWFAMTVARLVNLPESLHEMPNAVFAGKHVEWSPKKFTSVMNRRKGRGEKTWTSAYMIRAIEAKDGETKADYLAKYVLNPLWAAKKQTPLKGTLQEFHTWLQSHYGMGSFLAAQVVADVKWVPPLVNAVDWETFAAPGPGSQRGLNRAMGQDLTAPWQPQEWHSALLALRGHVLPKLPKELRSLDAQNLQNCLCEFDKYMRTRGGEGRPRQNFNPSAEPYAAR